MRDAAARSCRGSGRSQARSAARPVARLRRRRSASGSSSRRATSGRTSCRSAGVSRRRSSRRRQRWRPWSPSRSVSGRSGSRTTSTTRTACSPCSSDPNARVHRDRRRRGEPRRHADRPGRARRADAGPGAGGQGLRDLGLRERRPEEGGPLRAAGRRRCCRGRSSPGRRWRSRSSRTAASTRRRATRSSRPSRRNESVTKPWRLRSDPLRRLGSDERAQARTDTPVRIRGLPPRPGAGRPRRGRRPRHARADADRLGEVAHLPARGDAPADADARPLAADRADEGSGRQAAAGGRGAGDADQLVARPGRGGRAAAWGGRGPLPAPLRRPGAAPPAALPRRDRGDRHRPRRDRRGALRQHVGARLPARLPLHPPRSRRARPARDPRHDRHGDAGDGAGDRRRSRPGARGRPHERRPAEPALRRRDRRRRGGPAAHARAAAARPSRRVGDRLRPLAPQLRERWRARSASTISPPSTTTPGSSRRSARPRRRRSSRGGSRPSSRRPRSGWASTSPTSGSSRSTTTPSRSRATSRWSAAPGRDGRASDTLLLASRSDASQLRRFARSDIPTVADLRSVYARLRGRREVLPEELAGGQDGRIRASSSGCWSRSGSCSAASTPGGRCRSRCPTHLPTPRSGSTALLARYEQEALARTDRLVRFAESRICRHRQVAEHFGETLRRGLRHVRRLLAARGARRRACCRRRRCRRTSQARSTAPCSSCAGRSAARA